MRGTLFILVALVVRLEVALAQTRPDFSGQWTRVDSTTEQRSVAAVGDAAFRVGTIGNGWGSPLTIRQEGAQLVVEYVHFATYDLQPRLRFVYALDGSESRNAIMIGHAESVLRSRASWRDSSLVITTAYPGPTGSTDVRQVLTLESPSTLIVETTRSRAGGAAPVPTRTVYRRT
jgi:hypothetical protein